MKIIVYAHTDPINMFEAGKKAGLSEKAADYFRYFGEVKLELDVEPESGAVCNGRLLNEF